MDAPGLIPSLIGAPLADRNGSLVATVEDLLVDDRSHRPVWLLVRLRAAAAPFTFVPADRVASRAGCVAVPFDEDQIRAAPVRLAVPADAAREHAVRLCRHYGLAAGATWATTARRLHPARTVPVVRAA